MAPDVELPSHSILKSLTSPSFLFQPYLRKITTSLLRSPSSTKFKSPKIASSLSSSMICKTDVHSSFCDVTSNEGQQATVETDELRDDLAMKKLNMLDDYRIPDRSEVLHGAGFHCFKRHKERSIDSSCACGIIIVLTPAPDDQKPTLGRKGLSRRKTTYPIYNNSYLSPSVKPRKTNTERRLQGPAATENQSIVSKKVSFAKPESKDPLDALRSREVKNENRRRLAETRLSSILDKCIDNHLANKLRSMTLNTQKGTLSEDGKSAVVNPQFRASPTDDTMSPGSSISSDENPTSIGEHRNVSDADSTYPRDLERGTILSEGVQQAKIGCSDSA